jgi:hypothetical protein
MSMDQASDSLLFSNKYLELDLTQVRRGPGGEEAFVHNSGASDAQASTRAGLLPVLDIPLDITASSSYYEPGT